MKTIHGYVVPLLGEGESHCQVAVVEDDVEYHVVPRGAGADLVEHLSSQVEVTGVVIEEPDAPPRIQVRSYTLIDQDDDEVW